MCLALAQKRHAVSQHFSRRIVRGWGGRRRWVETSGQLHGRTWDSECSLMQHRQYLRSDGCMILEPDIFSRLEISRRDEISKWSTCLKMHGIPQGWARATGYKSSTPAPGVKTGRECDTQDLEWLAHRPYMCKLHTHPHKFIHCLWMEKTFFKIHTAPQSHTQCILHSSLCLSLSVESNSAGCPHCHPSWY